MPEEFPAVMVPVFEKTGASLAIFSMRRIEEQMFVARKDGCALLAFDRDRNNLGVEASAGLRGGGALLRA